MEINITSLFNEICPSDFSASIAEIGQYAGRDTWEAAKEEAESVELLTTLEEQQAFISHMEGMGFSATDDMDVWPHEELLALFIQLVSGDMREHLDNFGDDSESWDWEAYESDENTCGNLFQGDDGEIYYYLGV